MTLVGELDQVGAQGLLEQLQTLGPSKDAVRLDLSRLEFIDSSGVRAVIVSLRDASQTGRKLEVHRRLSSPVQRVFDVLGLDAVVWPHDGQPD